MADRNHIIAMDVGGSSVKSGLVDFDLNVTHHAHTPLDSKASADVILTTLRDIIQQHLNQSDSIIGVGFGFPSPFEYDKGIARIKGLEKFEGIYGLNIGTELQARLNQPDLKILFRNDAESAIVGEAKFGAGKGFSRMIGVTLGTGMGSGFVVDGKRVTSGKGVPAYNDGFLFRELYQGERVDDIFSTRGLLAFFDKANLRFETISSAKSAADNGDESVQAVFAQFGADLGDFLTPYATDFEAEVILVLGGISGAIEYFQQSLNAHLPVPAQRGTLGADAALLGAAESLMP